MLNDVIGPPQIAALLLLLQRGAEELYSARNTRALVAAGGFEIGRDYYPVVAVTHLAWIAALFFLLGPGGHHDRRLVSRALLQDRIGEPCLGGAAIDTEIGF